MQSVSNQKPSTASSLLHNSRFKDVAHDLPHSSNIFNSSAFYDFHVFFNNPIRYITTSLIKWTVLRTSYRFLYPRRVTHFVIYNSSCQCQVPFPALSHHHSIRCSMFWGMKFLVCISFQYGELSMNHIRSG